METIKSLRPQLYIKQFGIHLSVEVYARPIESRDIGVGLVGVSSQGMEGIVHEQNKEGSLGL